MRFRTLKAFSLVEILIVLALVGVLASLTMKMFKPTVSTETQSKRVSDFIEHFQGLYKTHQLRTGSYPFLDPDLCHTGLTPPTPNPPCTGTHAGLQGLHGMNAFLFRNDEGSEYGTVGGVPYLDYPFGLRLWLRPELMGGSITTTLNSALLTPYHDVITRDPSNTYFVYPLLKHPAANSQNYHEFMVLEVNAPATPVVPTNITDPDIVPFHYDEISGKIQTFYALAKEADPTNPVLAPSFFDTYRGI